MKKKKRHTRRNKPMLLFAGNVWVMPSIAVARAVYHTLLQRFLEEQPDEWSLVSGFFQQQPVLALVWDPARQAAKALLVAQRATSAGGRELEEPAKTALLTQLLTRRLALQAKAPFDTLVAHHPKGKSVWDLND